MWIQLFQLVGWNICRVLSTLTVVIVQLGVEMLEATVVKEN